MLTTDEDQTIKKVPKIDFSLFTMADGTVVNTKERVVKGIYKKRVALLIDTKKKDVAPPVVKLATDEQFWSKDKEGYPDIHFLKDHFYHEGRLTENQALYILEKGKELFSEEKNLLQIPAPVTGKCGSPTA
jgi:serine/threonine-protein phosphatase 2B catalytic subunit